MRILYLSLKLCTPYGGRFLDLYASTKLSLMYGNEPDTISE
jgi:hypothetical protein